MSVIEQQTDYDPMQVFTYALKASESQKNIKNGSQTSGSSIPIEYSVVCRRHQTYQFAVIPSNMNFMLTRMMAIKTIFLNFSWSILVTIFLPT